MKTKPPHPIFRIVAVACLLVCGSQLAVAQPPRPNILFLLTDDQRWDALAGSGNEHIQTPSLDRICNQGTRFTNAFATLAICSPSRAACLTGRYGSANGVTAVGDGRLNNNEQTFAHWLRAAGYRTVVTGKWHLGNSPQECGFDFASTCYSNGTWYNRAFTINGAKKPRPGFVDDVVADESIRFLKQASGNDEPFVLWMNTQVPHMDHQFKWPAKQSYLDQLDLNDMPLPTSWNDDLAKKPQYLKTARNRLQAMEYGYENPQTIKKHARDYYAGVSQMDAAVGRVLDELERLDLRKNTWIIFMGDNGWMLGEHGMTSKVLPYEESMRVPMAIAAPDSKAAAVDDLVLNIDLTATILELAGVPIPESLHGRSLVAFVTGKRPSDWRKSFLYEAPSRQLGSQPLLAVRTDRWKYIETTIGESEVVRELYDLHADPVELSNVAGDAQHAKVIDQLAIQLRKHQSAIGEKPRTDIAISGIHPHLTVFGIYSEKGGHYKDGHNECGIGAIVPWANKLWMVNYAPHMPKGSEHKLFSIDNDLKMTVHPESVGGTPAGRMIHAESKQLLIAHYLVDETGNIRVIPIERMPMRVTAIARHLTDPANMVYYIDMEGSIWEANVNTLEVNRLFKKPVPGWHGKGGYTSQGRLVISNNGELHVGTYKDILVGGQATSPEERGVLAEYDGRNWSIIERRQYTDVTGPQGIAGGSDGDDPIWTMGWDRRSVRLKVLDNGNWSTFLLPKAAFCNDASHGWYTEWPRIREITGGRWMMDMHGMFFDFPSTFSSRNSSGIKPIGSHLRYVPDFCAWNDKLVLASDETSIQGNPLAGQPQTNLWFGTYEDLKTWGPASGYGGPWVDDAVKADEPSDPFLVAGFDRRVLHLATSDAKSADGESLPAVTFTVEVDRRGDGQWVEYQSIVLPAGSYVGHLLPDDLAAIWLRLKTNRDCVATAYLHQTSRQIAHGVQAGSDGLFAGLANVTDTDVCGALVYAAKRNRNLRVVADENRFFDFTKAEFQFTADEADEKLGELLRIEPDFLVDEASVIMLHHGTRLRLPKGDAAFDKPFAFGWPRGIREVESERVLANIHGTFYEVPLVTNGAPPALHQMRPVASHDKQVTDFCSWNGLLVLAGVRGDAVSGSHIFADAKQNTALWFGGVDDLWQLGKPVGRGGPWLRTAVKAAEPSDAFLMTGYDKKTLSLLADHDTIVTIEVDFDHQSGWHFYKDFRLKAGAEMIYEFPTAFGAHWVRFQSSQACLATAQLTYE